MILTISKKAFFLFCLVLCAVAFCAGFCVHKLLPEETHAADVDAEDVSSMDAEHDRRIAEAESNSPVMFCVHGRNMTGELQRLRAMQESAK